MENSRRLVGRVPSPFAERLRRVRNWQSSEFYAALVIRPIAILVMLVIADWRFVTPNRLTAAANVAKLAAAYGILSDHFIWAAVLLQAGLLFDHLDGTLARYRGASTSLGGYFDKVSDVYTWVAITLALSWVVYQRTGSAALLLMGSMSSVSMVTIGYVKWVFVHEEDRRRWRRAVADPAAAVARENAAPASMSPPDRTPAQWLKFIGARLLKVVAFEEVDLFFWVGLFLVLDRLTPLIWLLAISQGIQVVAMTAWRAIQLARIDRERAGAP